MDGGRLHPEAEAQRQRRRRRRCQGCEGGKKLAKKGEELKEEMDSLMEEIDSVLEENAEEFVKNYVQKGGE